MSRLPPMLERECGKHLNLRAQRLSRGMRARLLALSWSASLFRQQVNAVPTAPRPLPWPHSCRHPGAIVRLSSHRVRPLSNHNHIEDYRGRSLSHDDYSCGTRAHLSLRCDSLCRTSRERTLI
ncbi:uncharacterized protein PHACADRAFT_253373 [Phanerochaete carnosa HHB-10118-sp]|uniref:Uncharacterized protein n=1 Tax=Phanerochaete carnosa (strain HHB-10118-sp) TaxID=650164 RepID=K5V1G1_PHACS|nr:uncharacterized protein PHACADRAFT_253373 [Phanerochaete carnosa HHB-10118-sp]EKM56311.1 hypothetical protein PHACADRAFT_253373 [Phanerochaete carnosa HHB-10118-sp]